MSPWSLASRLSALMALGALLVVGTLGVTGYRGFRSAYLGQVDRILQVMAVAVAAVVEAPVPTDALEREVSAIVASPWRGPANEAHVWWEGGRSAVVSTLARARQELVRDNAPELASPEIGQARHFDVAHKRRVFRAIWLRSATDRGVLNVLILHPANYEQRRLRVLLAALLAGGAGAVAAAALLALPLTRLAVRPLGALAGRLEETAPGEPAREPSRGASLPAELRPLVGAIDGLADRYRAALERQRALSGELSHHLRTPLATARSTLELLEDDAPRDRVRAARSELLEDLSRMQRLVDQLGVLARVESAPPSTPVAGLRLDALLEELAGAYQDRAAERRVHLRCARLAGCEIDGDEVLLRLLFETLIENALQYGPEGGTVSLGLELGPAGHCTAVVQDEGGRIPPEALGRLFDRFYRAEATRHLHPAGSGLGLTIALEIARRHGGDVWATSVPGRHTTFHVRIPAAPRGSAPETASGTGL